MRYGKFNFLRLIFEVPSCSCIYQLKVGRIQLVQLVYLMFVFLKHGVSFPVRNREAISVAY